MSVPTVDSNQVFKLWCNEEQYDYPAETFARVSKKCAALVKAGDFQGKITHSVHPDTFTAFSQACQLLPFKVTINNAYELLDLAQEWGIPSLETFVSKYIEDKGIKRRDVGDPLGDLILYMNEETKNPEIIKDPEHNEIMKDCISGVAKLFNQYLTDDRLGTIHPEILFKILTETQHINQQLLIDFAMKLFDKEPEKAVLLCLRIDFDLLTEAQLEEIFQCREIHEQAMGYFVADTMSAIRNQVDTDLYTNEEQYSEKLQALKEEITAEKTKSMGEIQSAYENEIAKLDEIAQRQAEQLEALKKLKEDQIQMLQDEEDRFNEEVQRLEDQLHNLRGVTEERQAAINERQELVRDQVRRGSQPVVENTNKQIDELGQQDQERRDKILNTLNPMLERAKKQYDTESGRVEDITNELQTISDKVSESFATLASKVVNDQFRNNYFLRAIENKYKLFEEEPKIWDLTPEQVEQAEQIVKRLESNVTTQCPLNVHHSITETPVNAEAQKQ